MKNGLICLLIVAILTICMPNVAAASTSKQTTEIHSGYVMDVPAKEQPMLVILLDDNATYVNQSVDIYGLLATGSPSAPHGIEGATVNIQRLNYDRTAWYTIGNLTTISGGKQAGFFRGTLTLKNPGVYIYRATYDGDSQCAPAVSNEVTLRVYSRG